MDSLRIQFSSVDSIVEFVKIMEKDSGKAFVIDEHRRLAATSFLGLVSMELDKPYDLIWSDKENGNSETLEKLETYRVKG